MLLNKLLLGVLLFAQGVSSLVLQGTPYYNFSNGCTGLVNLGLPAFLCKQESHNGDLYVLSSLTHQVLKLSEDENSNVGCEVYATLPYTTSNSNGVNLGASFSLGMTVDPSGNVYVSNTGTGPFNGDYGSVWKILVDNVAQPVKIFTATSPFGLPSGLAVDWRNTNILISSETDGTIYWSSLDGNTNGVWASASNPLYAMLGGTSGVPGFGGTIDNTNLFGAPFGPVASSISTSGNTLYVGSADRGLVCAITINQDGSAGDIHIVGSSPQHTIEGMYYDSARKIVYFGSVFRNGTNLTPDSLSGEYQGGVRAGNSLWYADLQTGESHRFYDDRLGSVCSVNTAKGILHQGQKKLFVVSSGFNSFPGWPLGLVRLNSVRAPYPSSGVNGSTTGPALADGYNGNLWIVDLE